MIPLCLDAFFLDGYMDEHINRFDAHTNASTSVLGSAMIFPNRRFVWLDKTLL
jgi:hypothetical protein